MNVAEIISAQEPLRLLNKLSLQIYPSKIRIEPNDKFTKVQFNLVETVNNVVMRGRPLNIVEKKNHKKVGSVKSTVSVHTAEDCSDTSPLDQFDLAVLSACISEWAFGNRFTTIAILYRVLTGKIAKGHDAKPSPLQREHILQSIRKLMSRIVDVDMTDTCELLNYNDGNPAKFSSAILPASYVEAFVGGKDVTTIFFDRESPCWTIASIKNQILRYDAKLLDVSNQQNTRMNIALKRYFICRVIEILAHRQLQPIITFDDLFQKCRISDADNKIKQRARELIEEFADHLQENGVIKSFELTKKANKFHSLTFSR